MYLIQMKYEGSLVFYVIQPSLPVVVRKLVLQVLIVCKYGRSKLLWNVLFFSNPHLLRFLIRHSLVRSSIIKRINNSTQTSCCIIKNKSYGETERAHIVQETATQR